MLTALILLVSTGTAKSDPLAAGFQNPPPSVRPHTWWHWMDGNVTKAGITADLEAMKQVGIGGAQMFTVSQDIPPGPAKYGSKLWRELTAYAVKEAARLGLELCIHNGAGWSSSGGPWVKPEDAMQVISWSETKVDGPIQFSEILPPTKAPRVDSFVPYHRDIAVYAYPTPAEGDTASHRPADFLQRTGVERGDRIEVDTSPEPAGLAIPASKILNLTNKLDPTGRLTWSVPAGNWTILRVGHVPTGVHNHPAPPEGEGLEVDKLSKTALDHFWAGLLSKVITDIGPKGIKTLNNVLIDSYEVGSQNWSPRFREAFRNRRGYDPLPYLPVITGRTIDNKEKSERFLWDLRRTIADLYADNYFGGLADLAHKNGMIFSNEPYGNGNFDNIQSGSRADIPMAEFWLGGGTMETTKMVSSVGHVYGRPIIGAESFTGDVGPSRWKEEPYTLKALGDLAFANGINRYIFHRYAMQPWLNLQPGMTMGPWGTHLERTQTWWTEAATWLKYVARCQYLLQAGTFKADACYYYGEDAPNDLAYGGAMKPQLPAGYDYDGCDAGALKLMSVKDGKIVLPSGMTYSVLVLPDTKFMTPHVARKLKDLVTAGGAIYGPKPTQSPSLTGFPSCDNEVRKIADELWGTGDSKAPIQRKVGKGHVFANIGLGRILAQVLHVSRDFNYSPQSYSNKLAEIHRKIGNADVYFVSNQKNHSSEATCTFRVSDRIPELWHPETGLTEDAPAFTQTPRGTSLRLNFDSAESVFVIFRKPLEKAHLQALSPAANPSGQSKLPTIHVISARYGSEDGRGADVSDQVRTMVQGGALAIPASNSLFGDPVVNVVKHLEISYTINGKPMKKRAGENEALELMSEPGGGLDPKPYEFKKKSDHAIEVTAWKSGSFDGVGSRGEHVHISVQNDLKPISLKGPWQVSFPPNLGAPSLVKFDKLISWPESNNDGVKYFSGSATYRKDFVVPTSLLDTGTAVRLNLGQVKNFATVKINGKEVAVLWKPPFALDVSAFIRKGINHLEVKVTNLWPNRMIGDEHLPPDVEWNGGHLLRWPDWLVQGKPRPKTGRVTFETWKFYDKNSPLLDSGLIGPVTLQPAKKVTVKY